MDGNNSDLNLVSSTEKKKYRARGCRGGSKNKKRLENNKLTPPTDVPPDHDALRLQNEENDVDETDYHEVSKLSSSELLKPAVYKDSILPYEYPVLGARPVISQGSNAPPNNHTHFPLQESSMKKFGHVPKAASSTITRAQPFSRQSAHDYYTKKSMDPNVTFDSINKLNQGYSSSSVTSSLMFRDSPATCEAVFPKKVDKTTPHSFDPMTAKTMPLSNLLPDSPRYIDSAAASLNHPSPSTSYKSLSYSLFSPDESPNTPTIRSLDYSITDRYDKQHDESTDSSRLNHPTKIFEISGYQPSPSMCDTSASSSTLSTKVSDRHGTYQFPSVPPLASYPNIYSSDFPSMDRLVQNPSYYYSSESASHLSFPTFLEQSMIESDSSLPLNDPHIYSSDSQSNPPFPTIFEHSIMESDSAFLSLPPEDSPLHTFHRDLSTAFPESIPRKIKTESSKKMDIYSHCLNQTRSQDYHSGKRQILPSWSIESDDVHKTSIKTVEPKKERGPVRVPLRLSSLPPMISKSYSSLRDNQYGNNQTVPPGLNSSVAPKNSPCQYTGALETFYRSFLSAQPDFLCNNNVWSEPNDETFEEQSFFHNSPHSYLFGKPNDSDSEGKKR